MKNILTAIYDFFASMGQAKAASALARAGYHKAAEDMMTK